MALKGKIQHFFKKLAARARKVLRKRAPSKSRKKLPASKMPKALPPVLAADSKGLQSAENFGIFEAQAERLPQPVAQLPLIPVSTAIDEFAGVQLSTHSRRAYEKDLRDFFSFCRSREIWKHWNHEITPLLVAEYRGFLLDERKLAKSSITRKLATLKSFFRWAKLRGWIDDNPAEMVRAFPQTQESKTGFLNDGEIERLLFSFAAPLAEVRLFRALCRVCVETLLMLGLRRAEAAAIRLGHLEHSDGRWLLRVQGKGDRERLLPLPPRLEKTWSEWLRRIHPHAPAARLSDDPGTWALWIRAYRDLPLLISTRAKGYESPLSTSEIGRIIRRSGRWAGLTQKLSPHMLRASAITHALDQGASHRGVQQMAGWTSPLMITRYDKRRKDPRHSAVHDLKYAREDATAEAQAASTPEASAET
jgi:integrase/recombinase XerC